jgi:hypothetical protein
MGSQPRTLLRGSREFGNGHDPEEPTMPGKFVQDCGYRDPDAPGEGNVRGGDPVGEMGDYSWTEPVRT